MKRVLYTIIALLMAVAPATAQNSPDFARKFMSLCEADSTVKCITVSPRMLEQLILLSEERSEEMTQVLSKLKSVRIVTADASYYQQAEELLRRNPQRFTPHDDYQGKLVQGLIFSRADREGNIVELVMLHEDQKQGTLTIVNLTGRFDEEFLCFLYNKSFKN